MFFATHVTDPVSGSGTLTGSCGDSPGLACRLAWDITHSTNVAQVVRVYLAGSVSQGLRILFVVVVALVIRAAAHRVINKITERAATATLPVTPALRPVIHPAVRAAGHNRRQTRPCCRRVATRLTAFPGGRWL